MEFIPADKFYLWLLLLVAVVLRAIWRVRQRTARTTVNVIAATLENVACARHISTSCWRVDQHLKTDDDAAEVSIDVPLRHLSWPNQTILLKVRCQHPDFEDVRRLNKGDVVEFQPLAVKMDYAQENELSGYLRIKLTLLS